MKVPPDSVDATACAFDIAGNFDEICLRRWGEDEARHLRFAAASPPRLEVCLEVRANLIDA